jgi:hypothetical protein
VFWALFETLNWAVPLDDLIGEIWRPAGNREGFEWRSRVPGAGVLDGVRYVRNRVHHQWADSARLDVDDAPSVLPFRFDSWTWRDVAELPVAPARRSDERGRTAYEQHLANDRPVFTLTDLAAVLERVVNSFLDPPRAQPGRDRGGEGAGRLTLTNDY